MNTIWHRRRKNRFGVEQIPVAIVGWMPSGYALIERESCGRILRHVVHPKNLGAKRG